MVESLLIINEKWLFSKSKMPARELCFHLGNWTFYHLTFFLPFKTFLLNCTISTHYSKQEENEQEFILIYELLGQMSTYVFFTWKLKFKYEVGEQWWATHFTQCCSDKSKVKKLVFVSASPLISYATQTSFIT